MLNPIGKVVYGQTKLSAFAINFRKTLLTPKHNGNIAVFEFIGESGKLETKAFTTLTDDELRKFGFDKKLHAEELGFNWLKDQGIKNDRVVRIYSELEPCMLGDHKCKQQIAKKFPDAKVSYSYSFTRHPQVMKKAVAERAKDLNKLIKN